MSDIARRLTRMSESELREYKPTMPLSRDNFCYGDPFLKPRNVRMAVGLVVFSEDLESRRKYLKEHRPKAFGIKNN